MQEQKMSTALLRKCFLAAAANVEKNKETINELNVFPVPDGDTGTNVAMTLMSAVNDVNDAPDNMEEVLKAMSTGALKGARGNSGVIFSQLIRGFTKAIREAGDITPEILAAAFKHAAETAYKAVMKPKEGTILTVAKGMSDKITELLPEYRDDLNGLVMKVIEYGDEVLAKTPEMLPVLKEAGVVDSGGMALMVAMKGIASILTGKEAEVFDNVSLAAKKQETKERHLSTDDIKFGYCTECIILLSENTPSDKVPELKSFLETLGDSIVCVEDDGVVKVHVHTDHPGRVFEKCLELGELSRIKVDNLREEHREVLAKEQQKPLKELAVVAVCAGSGLAEIFRLLGADYVVEGGQTMNPSIQDILNAAQKAHAKKVIVLPNNKNIILASSQAEKNTDGRFAIITVPSKTILQGVTAMMSYDPEADAASNAQAMTESLSAVKSGEVTYAVRNTSVDGFEIKKDDVMGIGDHGILAVGNDINEVTEQMIEKMVDDTTSLITVYAGEDVSDEMAEELRESLTAKFEKPDIDIQRGEQPVYYYLVSVE